MSEAQTIQVRVQVIDVQPSTLDLVLPAFLPVNDLVQRIARDAGLESFTEDGRRRSFWLRARGGRVMEPEETLSDLQVWRMKPFICSPSLERAVLSSTGGVGRSRGRQSLCSDRGSPWLGLWCGHCSGAWYSRWSGSGTPP